MFQAHACCSSGSLLRSQQTPWYEAFAEKGLDGAVESGEHCAKVVLSDPEMLHNAKMNFSLGVFWNTTSIGLEAQVRKFPC